MFAKKTNKKKTKNAELHNPVHSCSTKAFPLSFT